MIEGELKMAYRQGRSREETGSVPSGDAEDFDLPRTQLKAFSASMLFDICS